MSIPLRVNVGNLPEKFAEVSGEINALYAGSVFKGDDGGTQLDQRIFAKKSFGTVLGTTGKIEIDPLATTPTMTFYNTALNTTNQLDYSKVELIDTPANKITDMIAGNLDISYNDGVSTSNLNVSTINTDANINVSFSGSTGATSQTFIKSQLNQTEISVNVDDNSGSTASRTDITIGGACLDTHTATNGSITALHQNQTSPNLG